MYNPRSLSNVGASQLVSYVIERHIDEKILEVQKNYPDVKRARFTKTPGQYSYYLLQLSNTDEDVVELAPNNEEFPNHFMNNIFIEVFLYYNKELADWFDLQAYKTNEKASHVGTTLDYMVNTYKNFCMPEEVK